MTVTLSDFIYIIPNALDPDFCKRVIEKFDNDSRSAPGMVGTNESKRLDIDIKDSLDLNISGLPEWKEEDQVFFDCLTSHLYPYNNEQCWLPEGYSGHPWDNPSDSGYQIQKTSPKSGYVWHHDGQSGSYVREKGIRWATYIWYLNDVKEDGYTEFVDGTKIQPETGKFVLFPSVWPFIHRGYPPKSETKYIVTGWMHSS